MANSLLGGAQILRGRLTRSQEESPCRDIAQRGAIHAEPEFVHPSALSAETAVRSGFEKDAPLFSNRASIESGMSGADGERCPKGGPSVAISRGRRCPRGAAGIAVATASPSLASAQTLARPNALPCGNTALS